MKFDHVKQLRQRHGLTQNPLAKILKMAQKTYSQYETGVIAFTDEILIRLADHCHVRVDCLPDRTNDPAPPKDKRQ